MSFTIAKRYARALSELSREQHAEETVYKDLRSIRELIEGSEDFKEFLQDPVIPNEKRQAIIEKALQHKVHEITLRFIYLLNRKNRLYLLNAACHVFEKNYLDLKGVVRVKITSNIELTKNQVGALSKQLKTRLKKDIEPTIHDDPSVLGGMRIQEGDTIYDYSLKTQLEQFRKNLIKA